MNNFKKRCLNLRKSGHTLTEIVKITGRSKTSVYSHIHHIPLGAEKIKSIRTASGVRAKNLALARRGKSDRDFKKFDRWEKKTVLLVAHLIFDGTISRTSCVYNNRNQSLLDMVENCMKEIYNYPPRRWVNTTTGVSRISYHNVALGAYLQIKSKELLKVIYRLPKALKKEFVRAFFDDEGCMDFRPKRNLRQIRGYQKDVSRLFLIQKLLSEFNIESRVLRPNEVVISRKENMQKFQEEINFSPGVRLNGRRLNSVWKKPLEKQILLAQAIKSFKN
ncbi:MAG: LAGLIDADG family homing endonuclease [Minisyncoccia bacterium]